MSATTAPAGARNLHEERFAASLASLLYETTKPRSTAKQLVATAVAVALDECRLHLAAGRLGRAHDDPETEPESGSMAGGEAGDDPVSDDERLREYTDLLVACHEMASRASVRMVGTGRIGLAVRAMQTATDALIALHALDALTPRHDSDEARKEGE